MKPASFKMPKTAKLATVDTTIEFMLFFHALKNRKKIVLKTACYFD